MIHIIYLSIIAIGAVIWWRRESERGDAFDASLAENATLREKVETQARTLAKIQDLMRHAQINGIFNLGGKTPLSALTATADVAASQSTLRNTRPLNAGGRNFSGREQ